MLHHYLVIDNDHIYWIIIIIMIISVNNYYYLNCYNYKFHLVSHINQVNLNNTILIIYVKLQLILIFLAFLNSTFISYNHRLIFTDIIIIYFSLIGIS